VDDCPDTRASVCLLLRLHGHDAREAADGPAALRAAASFPPDVVLLDLAMPGMNGYKVCRRLRNQPATAQALLVAVSGYDRAPYIQFAWDAGFDHYLVKPITIEQLLCVVNLAVAGV
jgi:CheY-like chemotaxis protein